jgi:hypothetical protein
MVGREVIALFTPAAVTQFLRHLHYPLALRRSAAARVICSERRPIEAGEPLRNDDLVFVQGVAHSCLAQIESEPQTLRGAASRMRQAAILTRYEVKGEPRERITAELSISARQFYRERARGLQTFAALLADRVLAGVSGSRRARGVAVLAGTGADHSFERLGEVALVRKARRDRDLAQRQR